MKRMVGWLVAGVALTAAFGAAAAPPGTRLAAQGMEHAIYLPVALSAGTFAEAPTGRPAPSATATARIPPTDPPPSPTADEPPTAPPPSPTLDLPPTAPPPSATPPAAGRIVGRYVSRGEPISAGFGAPGVPQIELQRQDGGRWTKVANTETIDDGVFVFESPPPLEAGQVYQVWWVNTSTTGYGEWAGRWSSRRIAEFDGAAEVDLGTMEISNVDLTGPGNDVHFSLPVNYSWTTRDVPDESYRWSLIKVPSCDESRREDPSLYRTSPLGHVGRYTLGSAPPGFQLETLYCWYVFIDAGIRGTGWSFEGWKTKWLSAGLVGFGR